MKSVVLLALLIVPPVCGCGRGGRGGLTLSVSTVRVSVAGDGTQSNGASGAARAPSLSTDGRYVAFESAADNLVADDVNGVRDIFVRDRFVGTVTRASIHESGAQGLADASQPAISPDGRFIAFVTSDNMVVSPTGAGLKVYLRDLVLGTTTLVSTNVFGSVPFDSCFTPAVSEGGRYVAFLSRAGDLVSPPIPSGTLNVFRADMTQPPATRMTLVSHFDGAAAPASADCDRPAITRDGRFVAYDTTAALHADDSDALADVYLWDSTAPVAMELASRRSDGIDADGASIKPELSDDGLLVAFESAAPNLLPPPVPGCPAAAPRQVYLRDRPGATTTLVSIDVDGCPSSTDVSDPGLSGNGRLVTFRALVPVGGGLSLSLDQIFMRDRLGETEMISVNDLGQPSSLGSLGPRISGDGRSIAFVSASSNLVAGDTNAKPDVFVRTRP